MCHLAREHQETEREHADREDRNAEIRVCGPRSGELGLQRGKPLGYLVLQRRAQGLKTIRACVDRVVHGVFQRLDTPPDLRYRRLDTAHEGLQLRALRLERGHLLARRVLGRLDGRLQLGRQGTGGGVDVLRDEVV